MLAVEFNPVAFQVIEIASDSEPHSGTFQGIRGHALLALEVARAGSVRFPDPFVANLDTEIAEQHPVRGRIVALPAFQPADAIESVHDRPRVHIAKRETAIAIGASYPPLDKLCGEGHRELVEDFLSGHFCFSRKASSRRVRLLSRAHMASIRSRLALASCHSLSSMSAASCVVIALVPFQSPTGYPHRCDSGTPCKVRPTSSRQNRSNQDR